MSEGERYCGTCRKLEQEIERLRMLLNDVTECLDEIAKSGGFGERLDWVTVVELANRCRASAAREEVRDE